MLLIVREIAIFKERVSEIYIRKAAADYPAFRKAGFI